MLPAFVSHAVLPTSLQLPSKIMTCRRRPVSCSSSPSPKDQPEEYRRAEMLDDPEASASMSVWNDVIHASLKRKLQGLVAESPVTNGVSALLHTSPGANNSSSSSPPKSPTIRTFDQIMNNNNSKNNQDNENSKKAPHGLTPAQVVSYLLSAFKTDALAGAAAFVAVASENCHVKHTSPQTLVLFIGDNDSYRPLLRLTSFYIGTPRFEASGEKCVITVEIHLPNVGTDETAKFDFQLSCDSTGAWLIDEVFRL